MGQVRRKKFIIIKQSAILFKNLFDFEIIFNRSPFNIKEEEEKLIVEYKNITGAGDDLDSAMKDFLKNIYRVYKNSNDEREKREAASILKKYKKYLSNS